MKVRIDEIPPEGLTIDVEEDGNRLFEKDREVRFEENIRSHLVFHLVGPSITLFGRLRTSFVLVCGRCLEEFKAAVDREFALEYRPISEISTGGEFQLSADELDVQHYSHGVLDLDEVIMGQVAERVPLKPLCNESCRGLCPHCGENLNQGDCSCAKDAVDPRFGVLRDLLKKEDKT